MSPAEAGAVEFEEPDWRELFEDECRRHPAWPRYLQEDDAFEAVLGCDLGCCFVLAVVRHVHDPYEHWRRL